jgi:hypothetical protein
VGALPTYAPTNAPTKAPVLPLPTNAPTNNALSFYNKMGTGNALDSNGNLFSGVAFVATSQGPADDGNCASYCNQHKASFTIISNFTNHFIILFSLTPSLFSVVIQDLPTYVGMQIYKAPSSSSVVCSCLYSGGLPSPIPNYNPQQNQNVVNSGYGPITQINATNPYFTTYSYRNVGALPTYAPTNAPTKAPVLPSPTNAPTNQFDYALSYYN